jgi:DNA-directed RNA polymerase specialized sigma24 family protein
MAMQERSETILQTIDSYLVVQASKLMNLYTRQQYGLGDTLEVDELTQRVRIKLWKILEKKEISNLYPYVRRTVYNEFIDMKRQQKPVWPLSEESEMIEGDADPAYDFMQKIESTLFLHSIARMILTLPPRQRQSMLCMLHDRLNEMAQLQAVFHNYNMDLEAALWPTDKAEKRLLIASLSVARQKLAKKRKNAAKKRRFDR